MTVHAIGYDRGFGFVKAVNGISNPLVFPSCVTPGVAADGVGTVATVVEIDGVSYLIGDSALKQSTFVLEPALRASEHYREESRLLAAATMGLLAGQSGNHTCYVAAGLPSNLMSQKDRVRDMLLDLKQTKVTVIHGSRRYSCSVTVDDAIIIPQALGAALDLALDETGLPRREVRLPFSTSGRMVLSGHEILEKDLLILDVGYNTVLLFALSGLEPLVRYCQGSYTGMAHVYQQIGQMRQGQGIWATQQAILGGRMGRDHYEWAFRQLAERLNALVDGLNRDFDLYIIAGGGGAALYPYLLPQVQAKILVPHPQQANARGYRKAGMQRWGSAVAAAAASS